MVIGEEAAIVEPGDIGDTPPASELVRLDSVGVECTPESVKDPQACFTTVCSVLTEGMVVTVVSEDIGGNLSSFRKLIIGTIVSVNSKTVDAIFRSWLRSLSRPAGSTEGGDAGAVCSTTGGTAGRGSISAESYGTNCGKYSAYPTVFGPAPVRT